MLRNFFFFHLPTERKRTHNDDEDDDGQTSDGDGRRERYKRPALHDDDKGLDVPDSVGSVSGLIREDRVKLVDEVDVKVDDGTSVIPAAVGVAAPNATAPSSVTISIRALVSTKEAGIVIGKSGKSIAEIRERTGARVNVSEMIPQAVERIITVMGAVDQIAKVCYRGGFVGSMVILPENPFSLHGLPFFLL
jgi:hypothetical protein